MRVAVLLRERRRRVRGAIYLKGHASFSHLADNLMKSETDCTRGIVVHDIRFGVRAVNCVLRSSGLPYRFLVGWSVLERIDGFEIPCSLFLIRLQRYGDTCARERTI